MTHDGSIGVSVGSLQEVSSDSRSAGSRFVVRLLEGVREPLGITLITSGAILLLNVLSGVVLARGLEPAGRGELAAVILWPMVIGAVGALGIDSAATFYVARATASFESLVGSVLGLWAAQSVALLLLGSGVVFLVLGGYPATVRASGFLFLLYIPLGSFAIYLMAILNGLRQFGLVNVLRLMVMASSAAGVAGLFVADAITIRRVVLVYLAANLLTGLVAAISFARYAPSRLHFDRHLARALFAFGWRSHTSNVTSLFNERLDQLLISIFLAPALLGLYAIAVTLTSATGVVASVSMVAFPVVARLEDEDRRRSAAVRYVRITLLVSTLAAVPVFLFTTQLIRFFFGSAYESASGIARVLLIAAIALSTNRVLGAIARGVNRPLDAGVAEGIALCVTAGGLAVLLPALGIMGAAITSVLAYFTSSFWLALRVSAALGIHPFRLFASGGTKGGDPCGGGAATP